MKILITSKAIGNNSSDDYSHGLHLLKILLQQNEIIEVSWLMYFDYGFSKDLQQQYEKLASSVHCDKFPKINFLPIINPQSGHRGITFMEALVAQLKKSDYDLVVLPSFFTDSYNFRSDYTFLTRLSKEKQQVKMLLIGEYNLLSEAPDDIPVLFTGLSCIPEDGKKRLGVFTSSHIATDIALEDLIEKEKIALITDNSVIKMADVNFAYLSYESYSQSYNYAAFIDICLQVALLEGRKQCSVVLNMPIDKLEKHLKEMRNFTFIKKDDAYLEYNCGTAENEMILRLLNPFPLQPQTYHYLLKNSHILTGASGDSAYVEALSNYKLVMDDHEPSGCDRPELINGYCQLLKKHLPAELQELFDFKDGRSFYIFTWPLKTLPDIIATYKPQLIKAFQQTFDEIKMHHSLENNLWPAIKSAVELVPSKTTSNPTVDEGDKMLNPNRLFAYKAETNTEVDDPNRNTI